MKIQSLYLYLDMDQNLDLIIFHWFMFYHLQSMFTCLIFTTIFHDPLSCGLPRVAHFMAGGFGAKPRMIPALASLSCSSFQFVNKSQCNFKMTQPVCARNLSHGEATKEICQGCDSEAMFPCRSMRNVYPSLHISSTRNQMNKNLDLI